MKKGKKELGAKKPKGKGTTFTNPDVYSTDPNKEQFSPTDEAAIRSRKRMGGIG